MGSNHLRIVSNRQGAVVGRAVFEVLA